jgi:hypothetical protein
LIIRSLIRPTSALPDIGNWCLEGGRSFGAKYPIGRSLLASLSLILLTVISPASAAAQGAARLRPKSLNNYSLPQAPAGGPDCRRAHDQPRLPGASAADRRADRTGGHNQLVPDSGHLIQIANPKVILGAINGVLVEVAPQPPNQSTVH